MEKSRHLEMLLENYNDGRKKTFYCQAVNLLTLHDIRNVMKVLAAEAGTGSPKRKRPNGRKHFSGKGRGAGD